MSLDPKQMNAAASDNVNTAMHGFASASQAMQKLTNEMMAMSMESMRHTAKAFEAMQGAKSWPDILRIQTEFFRTSFEDFTARSKRIAELASAAPSQMAKTTSEIAGRVTDQTQAAATAVKDDVKAATAALDG